MVTGAQVNVRFHCTIEGCECETVVPARVVVRSGGHHLFEHTNKCPTCGHKLARHKTAEVPLPPEVK
jgi:hypothetical protein